MTTKSETVIRRATNADAELLADLGASTFYESFAADNKPEDMADYIAASFSPEKQAAELADTECVFFIAEIEGVAVGFAQLRSGDPPACVKGQKPVELVRIYVSQSWLGHGVGAALMRTCIEEARASGRETMWLGVWERNARAQAFYRKWNFSVVGEHVFQLGSDPQTDWLMECALK